MKRLVLLLLLLLASVCSAQVTTGGLTIPGDEAVQVSQNRDPFVPLEDAFPDGLIFSAYTTSYDKNVGGVATLYDRSTAGNHLTQTVEVKKMILGVTNGFPVLQNHNKPDGGTFFVEGRLVGIGSTTYTVAVQYVNRNSNKTDPNLLPYIYGVKTLATNQWEVLDYGLSAGSSFDRLDLAHGSNNDFTMPYTGIFTPDIGPKSLSYSVSSGMLQYAFSDGNLIATGTTGSPNVNLGADFFAIGAIPKSWVETEYTNKMDFVSFHVWNRALTKAEHVSLNTKLSEIKNRLRAGKIL